jgi:hypothetical protein
LTGLLVQVKEELAFVWGEKSPEALEREKEEKMKKLEADDSDGEGGEKKEGEENKVNETAAIDPKKWRPRIDSKYPYGPVTFIKVMSSLESR